MNHLAIIMDGNGRWAVAKNKPRYWGHLKGAANVEPILKAAQSLGFKYLTLYSFSTENWNRPSNEVQFLMKLFSRFLQRKTQELKQQNVIFNTIGDLSPLPADLKQLIHKAREETLSNTGIMLNIAINYSGREDLIQAINQLIPTQNCSQNSQITEIELRSKMWTRDIPDPDLMIRTSGELRISNFLIWESAYTEFYFTTKHWPDFSEHDLTDAVKNYKLRQRRFGRLAG